MRGKVGMGMCRDCDWGVWGGCFAGLEVVLGMRWDDSAGLMSVHGPAAAIVDLRIRGTPLYMAGAIVAYIEYYRIWAAKLFSRTSFLTN